MTEGTPIDPRRDNIILVGQDGRPVQLRADNDQGKKLLYGVGMTLRAAIDGGMIRGAPYEVLPTKVAPTIQTAERTLKLVTAEYKNDSSNPDLLGEFNQAFWNDRRTAMGLSTGDLVVSSVPYARDQIEGFRGLGDFGIFVPEVVSRSPDGLVLLGKAFPSMGSWAFQAGTTVLNADKDGNLIELFGWMTTEKAINAPNTRTTEQTAEDIIRGKGRIGIDLNVYAAAGQQSKLLEGKYLDQDSTWIRVLRSRHGGQVLNADFDGHGYCYVYSDLHPGRVCDGLGTRSVEVART